METVPVHVLILLERKLTVSEDLFTVGNGIAWKPVPGKAHPNIDTIHLFATFNQAEHFARETGLFPFRIPDMVAILSDAKQQQVSQVAEMLYDGSVRIRSVSECRAEAEAKRRQQLGQQS